MLPVDEVQIESLCMIDTGLGKSIYTKKQLVEFAALEDSQELRKAYLVETAELVYIGRNEHREQGLALVSWAKTSMIEIIGMSFIPM